MDNPETHTTMGTQDTRHTVGSKQTLEKQKGQSRMDNPKKHTTLGTQDTRQTVGSK